MSLGAWWSGREDGAPHSRGFYVFAGLGCLVAGAFFGAITFGGDRVGPLPWRIVFGVPATMFVAGAAQAGERLIRPERARSRAAAWSEEVRRRLRRGRWMVLAISVGMFLVLSITRHLVSAEGRDVCDDLRVLCLTFSFLFYGLADAVGVRAFEASRLLVMPVTPVVPVSKRRVRRSGLTVQDRKP